jgi:uncharacterized protein
MSPAQLPPQIVIIQPTTFCNIDCSYCYLPSRHLKHKMEQSVLEKLVRKLVGLAPKSPQSLLFSWHGGEPLSVGTEFFAKAFKTSAILAQHNYLLTHAIQTNGTLLTDSYARLFVEILHIHMRQY